MGGLVIIAVAAFAFWLARDLPAGSGGGMGPGTLPKGLAGRRGRAGIEERQCDAAARRPAGRERPGGE